MSTEIMFCWEVGLGAGGEEVGILRLVLYTFLQWFGCCTVSYILLWKSNVSNEYFLSWCQFYGKLSECLQRVPLDKKPHSRPAPWEGSALRMRAKRRVSVPGVGSRRATWQAQSHLGDGPGTAAPGVQHNRILVSFL